MVGGIFVLLESFDAKLWGFYLYFLFFDEYNINHEYVVV